MMLQREANQSTDEQIDPTYGRYEGEQAYAHQQFETPYQQPRSAGKVYAPAPDNKNVLRLIAFAMAMVGLSCLVCFA